MGKSGAVNVRKVAREVLLQDNEGQHAAALQRADALAVDHPTSALAQRLAGVLHLAAAVRARRDAAASAEQDMADAHLNSARSRLSTAKRLVPHCVDIATALGDTLAQSSLHREAEVEYCRALAISAPVDPAKHNLAYGLYGPEATSMDQRLMWARARAQRALDLLRIAAEVDRVLNIFRSDGAHAARPHAKRVAECFPGSARAQLLEAYMDLQFFRGLEAASDKRACLQRPLASVDRAAQSFPNSASIAAFRAKLLFLLGEYDAAERECSRALDLKIPHDPDEDCIPPGSISGADPSARLVSLSGMLRELVVKILGLAEDYWNNSMTAERRSDFMSVRLKTLQEEYNKVDPSSPATFTVSAALSFLKEHKSWRFWVCPLCDDSMKHTDTASLLDHLCSKHKKEVFPRLKSILDPKHVLEGDGSFGGVTFGQDPDQHDIMCFKPRNDIFKWMFCGPNTKIVAPKPFAEMREEKCKTGIKFLGIIKKKLTKLPTDTSGTKSAMIIFEIQEEWLTFVERSVLDYRQVILTLARSLLWRELTKCMAQDPKVSAQKISAADIDAVFGNATEDHVTTAIEEEQTKEKYHKSAHDKKAELHKV
ncbi:hypothetical protein QYE76_031979 [Lolium multiflorum]|uniref:DUF629 domain-containing protein n=1 Tax=Lolium multiflorum TaxID=4521 RepID=A0AAD8QU64_LOLMU|nr:hypothetical protein QYE76_019035 [Lolium multiflorum]KAK1608306.1 hypothetical protein QYE76_031979 [Lolium multiflorum]